MRTLFFVLLLANAALFGYGQGWFGEAPSQRMREPQRPSQEIQPGAIVVPQIPGINAPATPAPPAAPSSASTPDNPAPAN